MDENMNDELQSPEAELARLADGSLPASRQSELRAEVERSPELARALSEQQRAIAILRSAEVPAPDSLRTWVEEQTRAGTARRRPRFRFRFRLGLALPAAATLAAAAVVVIVLLAGGKASGPSFQQTAQLALAKATMPAPSEDRTDATSLDVSVAGIPFPYWEDSVGFRAFGTRADTLGGRSVVTVFYAGRDGDRVGYTIVPGAPIRVSGGEAVTRDGVAFTLLSEGNARLVTWLRSGHTCVIAGRAVSNRTLLKLATAEIPQ
jgi:hypothetical protein